MSSFSVDSLQHVVLGGVFKRPAPFWGFKPPARLLGAFFMTALFFTANTALATPAAHNPPLPAKTPSLTLQEKLSQTEKALTTEENDSQAESLMQKAELLRLYSVKNSGRLLLDEAQEQLKQSHIQQAEAALSAAITLQPDNGFLRKQRASIRFVGNDLTGAVEDLQMCLTQDPGDALAWELLARTQEHLHHPEAALTAFTNALTWAPLLPNGQKRYQQLERQAHGQPD